MVVEILNINSSMMPHIVVPIIGDGACLFRAISFILYDTQVMAREVREAIVEHVVETNAPTGLKFGTGIAGDPERPIGTLKLKLPHSIPPFCSKINFPVKIALRIVGHSISNFYSEVAKVCL